MPAILAYTSLSAYAKSSTFPLKSLSSSGHKDCITFKCLLKAVTVPDIDEAVEILRRRTAKVEDLMIEGVHTLLLSGNNITSLSLLGSSKCLHNKVTSISLADNLIKDVNEILKLSKAPGVKGTLKHLVVAGNPCMREESNGTLNRSRIIFAFEGKLSSLDGKECGSLSSIDQAVKTVKFSDPKLGMRVMKLTNELYSLDRAACALRVKGELMELYGRESECSSVTESENDDDLTNASSNNGEGASPHLAPVSKLLKVWSGKNSNTSGLDRDEVLTSLHRRLNKIIRKTRENRRSYAKDWTSQLEAHPSAAFDEICRDWDAAFASLIMPLDREVQRLELECRTLTGEIDSSSSVTEGAYADLERSALSWNENGEEEASASGDEGGIVALAGAGKEGHDKVHRGGGEEPVVGAGGRLSPRRSKKVRLETFFVPSPPSTPPGSIRSNEKLPAFESEEAYRKQVTQETYNQLLQKMETGKLHNRGYVKASRGEAKAEWVHPPTLSSPPRSVRGNGGRGKGAVGNQAAGRMKPGTTGTEAADLASITQGINHSRPIVQSSLHHENSCAPDEVVNWDALDTQEVLKYTGQEGLGSFDWALPVAPALNPPERVMMPKPPVVSKPTSQASLDTMKKLYKEVDGIFDALCDNHDIHLSLFQINSALRKCADSFSAARKRYLVAVQSKFIYIHGTMEKWKKEDPKLGKAVEEARGYIEKINNIEEAKAKNKYDLEAMKRRAVNLHKEIDKVRDGASSMNKVREKVAKEISEATSRLKVSEREQIEKDRELEVLARQFVARATMRQAFSKLRKRTLRQKSIKLFHSKMRTKVKVWACYAVLSTWRQFTRETRDLRMKVRTVQTYQLRRVLRTWKSAHLLHSKSSEFLKMSLTRKARFAMEHWHARAKNRNLARKHFAAINQIALLKYTVLRWRRFKRASALSPGEMLIAEDKADKVHAKLILRRWRRRALTSIEEGLDTEKQIRKLMKRKTALEVFDHWYFRFSVKSMSRRCLKRRMLRTWKCAVMARMAALAFWDAATHQHDIKLKIRVFTPWCLHAKRQKKLKRERQAVSTLIRQSAAASVFLAWRTWRGIWTDWKKLKRDNVRALGHYFGRLEKSTFCEWRATVSKNKRMSWVLSMFANVSKRAAFLFGLKKWKHYVLQHRRGRCLNIGTNAIIANFVLKWLGREKEKAFFAWKRRLKKKKRCARLGEMVKRRAKSNLSRKTFRSWFCTFLKRQVKVWNVAEEEYAGANGRAVRLERLSKAAGEASNKIEDDDAAISNVKNEMASDQGALMEAKMKKDSQQHRLAVVKEKLKTASGKLSTMQTHISRKKQQLEVTKDFYKDFKRRPDEEKWSLGTPSVASAVEGAQAAPRRKQSASMATLTEEITRLLGQKMDLESQVREIRASCKSLSRANETKVEAARSAAEEAESKKSKKEQELQSCRSEIDNLKKRCKAESEELAAKNRRLSALVGVYANTLSELEREGKEMQARIEVADRRAKEADQITWRKNAQLRGLKDQLAAVKGGYGYGKPSGHSSGKNNSEKEVPREKFVFAEEAEILASIAISGARKVEEQTKISVRSSRDACAKLVKEVAIYDDFASGTDNDNNDFEGGNAAFMLRAGAEETPVGGAPLSDRSLNRPAKKSVGRRRKISASSATTHIKNLAAGSTKVAISNSSIRSLSAQIKN